MQLYLIMFHDINSTLQGLRQSQAVCVREQLQIEHVIQISHFFIYWNSIHVMLNLFEENEIYACIFPPLLHTVVAWQV